MKNAFLAALFGAVLLISCAREEDNVKPSATSDDDLIGFISTSTGVEKSKIVYDATKKHFVLNGDVLVTRQDAEDRLKASKGGRTEHWRYNYLVSNTYVTNIKVYINPAVPSAWQTATRNALTQWNNINGTKLFFSEVTSSTSANIRVITGYEAASWVARAYLPTYNGRPGTPVEINTYYNSLPSGQKLFAMVHELGHTFGLLHTDQTSGTFITGTPTTDPNSVMNSYVLNWNGFTTGDVSAVQILYPQ
ncbi:M57 family metalloprotease [Cytophagaceae bacterium DM2B3-1]|uniref:M57 family metalloprotease n=1 Tax=Xanthocytophaga flava TaxID=3048013 RepID=A0ABT7CFL9_9BACT|nr:M57 family metalloprotease [Xanthocytophaga flavus]MDJ1466543.1 M57 family metalloprotease [Xanthocytophaga flavus]MDJ1492540.1 M57 family metalloprotease [Xanthocytophaga flavus]